MTVLPLGLTRPATLADVPVIALAARVSGTGGGNIPTSAIDRDPHVCANEIRSDDPSPPVLTNTGTLRLVVLLSPN